MPAPVACTGRQHYPQLRPGRGRSSPVAWQGQSVVTEDGFCPSRQPLLSHPLTILFFVPQKHKLSTASWIHCAGSHLSAFACVCLSLECSSHPPSSPSLLILDYMQPSSFLGRLPRAHTRGPTLLLAQHLNRALAHQIRSTSCALSARLLGQSKKRHW